MHPETTALSPCRPALVGPRPRCRRRLPLALLALLITLGVSEVALAEDSCNPALNSALTRAHAYLKANDPYADEHPPPKDGKVFYIEDGSHNLDTVMKKLVELTRKDPKRKKVRIGFYGDSNHVPDYASGAWRTILGGWFGYGGHGFMAAAKPWPAYAHREMELKTKGWSSYAASTPKADRPIYGHAGIVGFGNGKGAALKYTPKEEGAPENRAFSTVTVSYLCYKRGGKFKIIIDDKKLKEVNTRCDTQKFGSATVKVKNGEHTTRIEVTKGNVTFFGTVFENDSTGVVVDGLGVGALNLAMLSDSDAQVYKDSIKDRNYDMVVFHTGTNMWAPNVHPKWAKEVIGRIREALGKDVSIIFLSPPDFARRRGNRRVSQDRMQECAAEKQEIARNEKIAFWDFFQASGGLGAISNWDDKKYVLRDLVHYKEGFHQIMSRRFAKAFLQEFENYLLRQTIDCDALHKDQF